MICTEIYGSGVQIIGLMSIPPRLEIAALIKTRIAVIALHAAARGMNLPPSAGVRRVFEFFNLRQMSLWGFEWFAIGSIKVDYKQAIPAYLKNKVASCATKASRG